MTKLKAILSIFPYLVAMDTVSSDMRERAIQKYNEAAKYPRKKKKQLRKEANLDYNIACWNPFDDV